MLDKFLARFVFVAVAFAMTPSLLSAQKSLQMVEPTQDNFEDWKAHVLPEQGDLVWRNVAWKTTFGEGVVAANEADKPLLLWVMNGHPFGCT